VRQKVVFLIGASGVGKTAVAQLLEKRHPWINNTFYSDSIGVPTPEEMERWPRGGEGWQQWATEQWVARMAERSEPIQLLEMQTRPSFILPAVEVFPKLDPQIILLECSASVRVHRLTELRQQPELANARMENWAIYLRGQAEALRIPSVQTDDLTLDEVAAAVEAEVLNQA